MSHPTDVDPGLAQRAKIVPHLKDVLALKCSLWGDMTFAELLGQAVPTDAGQIEIHNLDAATSLFYNPVATATNANAEIVAGGTLTVDGAKELLDLCHLYANVGSDAGISVNLLVRATVVPSAS